METKSLEERLKAAGGFRGKVTQNTLTIDELKAQLDNSQSQIESLTTQLSSLLGLLKENTEKLNLLEVNQTKLIDYVTN